MKVLDRAHRSSTPIDEVVRRSVRLARSGVSQSTLTVCLALGMGAHGALADEPGRPQDVMLLEEIVVTAQKRTEKLQDVPISAEVITADQLAKQNLDSLADVAQIAPSVRAEGTIGRSGALYVRGIGSGSGTSFDQSVGTFVDDIYHGRSQTSSAEFLDVERVEILKGPQSTFFGNNAIAGAFNIATKQPTNESEGSARALYGQFGQYEAEAAVNVPVNDRLQFRVAAMANGEDGWLDNVNTGEKYPHDNNIAARATIRFEPTDDLDATLKIEGADNKDRGGLFLQLVGCPPPAPFVPAGFCKSGVDAGLPQGIHTNRTSATPGQQVNLSTLEDVLTVNYHQWGHTFTSVTGFYGYHYQQDLDLAATPVNEVNVATPQHYHQLSQEFRVASPEGQVLEYLGGLYFQTDQLVNDFDQSYFFLTPTISGSTNAALRTLVPYLPLGQDINYRQQEHTYSAFGSTTWNVTDTLKLSAGLRASEVTKDYDWHLFYGTATGTYGNIAALPAAVAAVPGALGLGKPGTLSGNRSDHALMPSLKTQYQLFPAAMLYLSYARGFKAGGFNADDNSAIAANIPFGPEHVNAYEAGLKSELFDQQLLLNAAVFRSDYAGLQVTRNLQTAAGTFISTVANAATVRSQGVEFEGKWLMGRHFSLDANATYLDSRYTCYINVSPTSLQALEGLKLVDNTGLPTTYAPKWSGNLSAVYSATLPGGYNFSADVEPIAASNYYYDVLDRRTGAYVRLDSRLTLESPNGRWNLDLIGKNLADRDIVLFQGPQATATGTVVQHKEQPRSVAAQIRFKW